MGFLFLFWKRFLLLKHFFFFLDLLLNQILLLFFLYPLYLFLSIILLNDFCLEFPLRLWVFELFEEILLEGGLINLDFGFGGIGFLMNLQQSLPLFLNHCQLFIPRHLHEYLQQRLLNLFYRQFLQHCVEGFYLVVVEGPDEVF